MFYRSCLLFLYNIANVTQRTFEIVQKSRLREHGDIIISPKTSVCQLCARMSPVISMGEVPRDISRKLYIADFVCDNGVIDVSLLHV